MLFKMEREVMGKAKEIRMKKKIAERNFPDPQG
jgi:hypothetical protein